MIVAERKPIKEIEELVMPYRNLLILGCGTCVKTCFTGGEEEVSTLAALLQLVFKKGGREIKIEELTIERQCEDEFIGEAAGAIARNDAVLSLACGAGAQAIAKRFYKVPVLPGVNTTFLGILEKQGVFTEECVGCGDCVLAAFGGICPITRCAKKLLNGPCGGSRGGKCEVNQDTDCAWNMIIDRCRELGQLENLRTFVPAKDWNPSASGGPRKLVREELII